jgi:hypothetical protein
MILEFYRTDFFKNSEISNFMKICMVGAKFFHADGQPQISGWTDMMKIIVAFLSFVNAPKNFPE